MLFNVSMYPHKHTLNVCNKFYYISFDSSSVKSSQLHSSFVEVPIIIITSYIAYLGLSVCTAFPNLDLVPKLHTLSSRGFSSSSKWGPVQPDPKKRRWSDLKNNFSWPCRLQFDLKIRRKLSPLSKILHTIPDGELCKFDVPSSDQFPINNDNPSG